MVGGGTQGFVSSFPDGTDRFLPFDWSRHENAWFCNTARIAGWWTPGAERARLRRDEGWVLITPDMKLTECGDWPPVRVLGTDLRFANCQGCHGSQITLSRSPDTRGFTTETASLTINCESCHGPGREHVDLARSGGLASASDPRIGQLAALDEDASLEVCFQCHALKRALQTEYLPGESFENHYSLLLPLLSDDAFFPDFRVRTFAYQLNHRASACYLDGAMTCVDCHAPHGMGYRDVAGGPLTDRFDDEQCTSCHASKAAGDHTGHPAGSEGSRCVACHMPYLQQPELGEAVRYARSDHTIPIPRPAHDRAQGVQDACGQCHTDRSAAELQRLTTEVWGELKPHRAEIAAAVAGATEGAGPSAGLLPPDNPNAMAQVAAINRLVDTSLAPDMADLDASVAGALMELAGHVDIDVRAVSLAALHMAGGSDPDTRSFLTATLEDLGDRQEPVLRRWIASLRFMGDAYRERGEVVDALAVFGQTVTWVNLGLALEEQGAMEEAAGAYETAVDVYAWEALAQMNLGNLYLGAGEYRAAIGRYRLAVEADPSLSQAYYYKAVSHLQVDERSEAVEALRHALEFSPDHGEAMELLASLGVGRP
jgi:hypothetical protein